MLVPDSCARKLGCALALLSLMTSLPCMADAVPEFPDSTTAFAAAVPAPQIGWNIAPMAAGTMPRPRLLSADSGRWIASGPLVPSAESGRWIVEGARVPSAESGRWITDGQRVPPAQSGSFIVGP
jgi:hypothetical protein